MYKNFITIVSSQLSKGVSILVLMELCIKTFFDEFGIKHQWRFNPCFNGTMYKNNYFSIFSPPTIDVSILVLMELCIKTKTSADMSDIQILVSILVLMELCIKTN